MVQCWVARLAMYTTPTNSKSISLAAGSDVCLVDVKGNMSHLVLGLLKYILISMTHSPWAGVDRYIILLLLLYYYYIIILLLYYYIIIFLYYYIIIITIIIYN